MQLRFWLLPRSIGKLWVAKRKTCYTMLHNFIIAPLAVFLVVNSTTPDLQASPVKHCLYGPGNSIHAYPRLGYLAITIGYKKSNSSLVQYYS